MLRTLILIGALHIFIYYSHAANYYWVGGTGNWSDLNHWATASGGTILHSQLPGQNDDVFFDANSFPAPGQVVTINAANCIARSMDWTGATFSPKLYGLNPNQISLYGSLKFIPGMTLDFSGRTHFLSTNPGNTITTAGKFIHPTFNGVGGEWTLLDPFTTSNISLFAGTLNSANQEINASQFSTGTTSLKVLTLGSSVVNLSANGAWTTTAAGFSLNSGTSIINCSGTNVQFTSSSTVPNNFNTVNFSSSQMAWIYGNSNFNEMQFSGPGKIETTGQVGKATFLENGIVKKGIFDDLIFAVGKFYEIGEITVTGLLTASGNCSFLTKLRPVGNVSAGYIHFTNAVHLSHVDINGVYPNGTGPFTISSSFAYCCYPYGYSGWTYVETPLNMYWIGNGGNWSDPAHWSYTSGGPPSGCIPYHDTNVFFDSNSFTSADQTVLVDGPFASCKNLDWTGVNNFPTLHIPQSESLDVFGSLVLSPEMDVNSPGWLVLEGMTPGNTVSTNGIVLGNINFRAYGLGGFGSGEYTLLDDLTVEKNVYHLGGTLNTNGKTVNAVQFYFMGYYIPKTLNMGASVFNLTGREGWLMDNDNAFTIHCGTSTINLYHDSAAIGNIVFYNNKTFTLNDVNFLGDSVSFIGGPLRFRNVFFKADAMMMVGTSPFSIANGPFSFNNVTFSKNAKIYSSYQYQNIDFTPGYTYEFEPFKVQKVFNRMKLNGNCIDSITIRSTVSGSYTSIVKSTDSIVGTFLKIRDIHANGGATFKAYNSNNEGGNAGFIFSSQLPPATTGNISGPDTLCAGVVAVYHVEPVAGAILYQWNLPPGANIINGQGDSVITIQFENGFAGNIEVQATDGCNFAPPSSFPVYINPQFSPSVNLQVDPGTLVCPGTVVNFIAIANETGGNANYDFKINGITRQSGAANAFLTMILDGDIVSCEISVSGGQCYTSTTAVSNEIIMDTSPTAQNVQVNAGPDITIIRGETIQFTSTGDPGNYLWSPPTGLNSVNILNPFASPVNTIQYNLTITSSEGCVGTDDLTVFVTDPVSNCSLKPAEAFTPNGDGINDRWIVYSGNCEKSISVSVFNRYGSVVFHSDNYQNNWEGKYKGKNLPDGTYYAVIRESGKQAVHKTNVTILR